MTEVRGVVVTRLEIIDPGRVRTRRGIRAACATALAWATMFAVTTAFGVDEPLRITLFAAGAAFEGALLAPDPQPKDRVRTLGWAIVVSAVAVVVTVWLSMIASWLAASLLVVLMFSSYALRGWSPRLASLALMGAITVYITGGGHITVGRVGWFVLAAAIGFAWLALWERVILPEDPLSSLRSSVQAFTRRAADCLDDVVGVLSSVRDGRSSEQERKSLRKNVARVESCRGAIEQQSAGAILRGQRQADVDRLRVTLHSAQKGLQDMADQVDAPGWTRALPVDVSQSLVDTLHALAVAIRDERAVDHAANTARLLRSHLHDEMTRTAAAEPAAVRPGALLGALVMLSAGEVVARSLTQAVPLATVASGAVGPTRTPGEPSVVAAPIAGRQVLSPAMALAIQAAVAAVAAGALAKLVGNEQSLVVAWTAFVVIAGSAGLSTRRAMARIPATMLGAVGGVLIAATVPDTVGWTVAVAAVGVFFTVTSAPVSYPAMVFWMSIALVPLFASQGQYLDLIWDKSIAALIGGCVAAAVALVVVPIRASGEVRPAIVDYLGALDTALAAHLPGHEQSIEEAEAELDAAHAALTAKVVSAANEINVFSRPENIRNPQTDLVDAVHEAYRRLTPLLSDSSRLLHGCSDHRVENGIRQLRAAVGGAESSARGVSGSQAHVDDQPTSIVGDAASLGLSDSLRRVADLHARLAGLRDVLT